MTDERKDTACERVSAESSPLAGDAGAANTKQFYDGLTSTYDNLFGDWDKSTARQGKAIHKLIVENAAAAKDPGSMQVLDCAAGIGTQALGLAKEGYQVTATDLSPKAIDRLLVEATSRGLCCASGATSKAGTGNGTSAKDTAGAIVDAKAGAFSELPSLFPEPGAFDVVIAMDNALPHVLTDEGILTSLRAMKHCLVPGGLLILSTRPYDSLAEAKPEGTMPYRSAGGYGFQVWDWHKLPNGSDAYTVQLFMLTPAGSPVRSSEAEAGDVWRAIRHKAVYRALQSSELLEMLRAVGFTSPKLVSPDESGFFQPVFLARCA